MSVGTAENPFLIPSASIRRVWRSFANSFQKTSEDEGDFPERRVLYRLHRQRERNASLVKKKKQLAKSLACEVCGFDFLECYGELGKGYIECHHTKPISEYQPGERTKLADLALVCANCHRMLHRKRPWLSIEELKLLLRRSFSNICDN